MKNIYNKEFQTKRFKAFKKDVEEFYLINIDELYMLINRHTHTQKKSFFKSRGEGNFFSAGRIRYHRYWIKMLEGIGVLEPLPHLVQTWKVIVVGKIS